MDLPTRLDLYSLGRDYVLQRATKIDPAQIDTEGSDANIFIGSTSVVNAQVVLQLGYRTSALLLDSAEGDDLDRYAWDRYQLIRKGASPALGTISITRPSVALGAGTIPIGTKLVTLTGVEYITTTTSTFGTGDLSSSANVRAVQAGKATQVGARAITRFAQVGTLFDGTLVATNPDPTAGGEDAESDDVFRSRIRDFWRTARRGILAAIEFGAKTVPGVVSAQAIEALTEGAQPARVVNLYISDSTGVASNALGQQVRTALDEYRAGGIAVLISTSIPLIVTIELHLQFRANVDTPTISDNVRAAVVEFVNSLPVNGPLYQTQLKSVLQRYTEDGLIPADGTIVAPVGDLVPSVGQTIRTTTENVVLV